MSAQLKPIDTYAVLRPTYDNTHVAKGSLWMKGNDANLRGYYLALGGRLAQAADDNITAYSRAQKFLSFCMVQWDRERMSL